MKLKQRVSLLVSILFIALLVLVWRSGLLPWHYSGATGQSTSEKVLLSIRTADEIPDPYRRCMSYPNARRTHWSAEIIEVFCSDTFTVYPAPSQVYSWIEDENKSKLNEIFNGIVEAYFSGQAPEGALRFVYYDNFNYSTEEADRLTSLWIKLSPESAHAQAARGLHLMRSGIEARGEKVISKAASENLQRMRDQLSRAREHLETAIQYDPRIMPAYAALITVAQYMGDRKLADSVYENALAIDDKNYHVRYAFLKQLRPRWGGSHEEMDDVVEGAEAFLSENPRLSKLRAIALGSRGWHLYFLGGEVDHRITMNWFEKGLQYAPSVEVMDTAAHTAANDLNDHLRAVELYSQILRFNPANARILKLRAYSIARLGQTDWAMAEYRRILELTPNDRWVLRDYAWLLEKSGNKEAAAARLVQLHALDPSDWWVTWKLAKVYLYEQRRFELAQPMVEQLLETDPENGAAWLLRVDLLQNTGEPGLREAIQQFVRYADPSVEEQQIALEKARVWLERH